MDIHEQLNREQYQAVVHGEGPLLILAGAGSGKTRALTHRIAHLVREKNVDPYKILAVTFTNKAAGEMRERIQRLLGQETSLWALTFHSFGARILRRHAPLLGWRSDFSIYDNDDSRRLAKKIHKAMDLDSQLFPIDKLLSQVERAKQKIREPADTATGSHQKEFFRRYQKALLRSNAFDFSDLIYQTNRLFQRFDDVLERYQNRFTYVLVDEFQDTNFAQFQLLKQLSPPGGNLTVVGDDDQSIYQWRGAEIQNILNFRNHYPGAKTITLERNYRSSANILEAAGAIISQNDDRYQKSLWTTAPPGAPVVVLGARDEQEEAKWVVRAIREAYAQGRSLSEIAVLYRINAQSRALEEGLRLNAIVYRIVGGVRFFERAEIRDMLAYLRLCANPRSDVDLLRIINVPPRGLGQRSRQYLVELADQQQKSLAEVLLEHDLEGLRKNQRQAARDFSQLLKKLFSITSDMDAPTAVIRAVEMSGYVEHLRSQGTPEATARGENLDELVSAAQKFAASDHQEGSLLAFLEQVALITDIDLTDTNAQAVTLMTLHAAKGLEFEQIIITGVEEGLLPHRRSIGTASLDAWDEMVRNVAEERRLFYVGMTRARVELLICHADSRMIAGKTEECQPSRFLRHMPQQIAPHRLGKKPEVDLLQVDLDDDDGIMVEDSNRDLSERIDYGDEYNQDFSSGPDSWSGRFVEHKSLGRGLVRHVEQSSLGHKMTVEFDLGVRKILSRYLRLVG